jgi:hypothetical protein
MRIDPNIIQIISVVTFALCLAVVFKWRKDEFVPVHWLMFVMMALGALAIGLFYFEIDHGYFSDVFRVFSSRLLWLFVLVSTSIMAISALLHRRR